MTAAPRPRDPPHPTTRRRRTTATNVFLLVAVICGPAHAEPPLTREAYVARVLAESPAVRALAGDVAVAEAERDAAGRPPNPTLAWARTAAVSGDRADETEDDLALTFPLVLSGRLRVAQEAATEALAAAEARREHALARLRRAARLAYDRVLAARDRRRLLTEALEAVRSLEEVVAARERAGTSAGYDLVRMSLERALVADLLDSAATEAAQAEAAALALLGGAAGLPDLADDTAAGETPPPPSAPRADLRALAHEAAAAGKAALAAERRAVPDPAITAGARLLDIAASGRGYGYVIGLEVPLPVLDAGNREAAVARARAAAAEAERDALELQVGRAEAATRARVEALRDRLARHRTEVLERADQLRALAATAFRAGGADILTLLDAERVLREARLTAIELALALREAETDLFFVTGSEP